MIVFREAVGKVLTYQKKRLRNMRNLLIACDSDRTQTCNLLIRSQMLYSIKLRSRFASANIVYFCALCKFFFEKSLKNRISVADM